MAFTIVDTQTIIARNAGALYGVAVGYTNMNSYVSQVGSNVDAFLNTVYTNSVGTASTADVASVLITNLGITGDSTDPTSAAGQAKSYIVGQLNAVAYTARGAVVNNILSLFSNLTTDPTFGSLATAWNTKVTNAKNYASISTNGDTTFTGVSTAQGQTFTLTTGIDIKTGGTGDDTFDGSVNANGTATFTSVDQLNGGDGTDYLVAGLAGGNIAAKLSNIENAELITSAATTFDLINTTGLNSLTMRNSSAALTVNNIGSTTGTSFTLQDQSSDVNLNFSNAALSGANTFTLNLSGAQSDAAGGADIVISQQAGSDSTGLETLTIASGGSNANFIEDLTVQNGSATSTISTLKVTGSQSLTISSNTAGALATSLRTVDASGMTGTTGLSATFGATAAVTVTGSGGSDTLTFNANNANSTIAAGGGNDVVSITNFDTNDSISGGAGTADRLDITAANAEAVGANLTNLTDFEQLSLNTTTTAAASVNATRFGAIDTLRLDGGTGGAFGVTMQAGTVNLQIASPTAASNKTLAGALTVTDTGTASTDILNLTNRDTDTTSTTDNFAGAAITFNGYETVNLDTASGATVAQTVGVVTLNNDNMSAANTLNVSGANSVTIARVDSNSSGLLTINASGLTGTAALTMTAAPTFTVATGTVSVTGSANADTLKGTVATAATVSGGAGNDNITGGTAADTLAGDAGNDAITGAGGNDTITGGEGNDTVTATVAGTVSIDGGAGNDNVNLAATLTASDVVAGGDGTDTLRLSGTGGGTYATAATAASVSGFETISLEGDTTGGAQTVNQGLEQFTNNTGFTQVNFSTDGADTIGVTNAGAGIINAQIDATTGAYSFARLVDTSSNSLSLTAEDAAANGAAQTTATLTLNDEETLVFSTGTASDATANNGTGEAITITTLNASDLTSLTVSGSNAFTITNAIGGAASLATINANGLTAAFSVNASTSTANITATGSTTAANTITGGTGADTITGGTAADSLTGGNGADSISGGAGADSLLGGLGNDVINGDIGNDTITGGIGNDTLNGGDGADDFVFEAASNGVDTIASFVSGTDNLNVTTNVLGGAIAGTTTVTTAGAATGASIFAVDNQAFYLSFNGAAANLTTGGTNTLSTADMTASTLTNLATYLGEYFNAASAANTNDVVVVVNWTAGGSTTSYLYEIVNDNAANTLQAGEITLLGVVDRGATVLSLANTDLI